MCGKVADGAAVGRGGGRSGDRRGERDAPIFFYSCAFEGMSCSAPFGPSRMCIFEVFSP